MDNELANELTNARAERMLRFSDQQITEGVINSVRMIDENAWHALQGIDAENNGLTKDMFEQAVMAAEMDGGLLFPGKPIVAPDDEPCSWEVAKNVVFGRVARAIIVLNGMTQGFGPPDSY